jgi:uncharacterized pyridoxal phosphate-dependent enzyme
VGHAPSQRFYHGALLTLMTDPALVVRVKAISRRRLFRRGGALLAVPSALRAAHSQAASATAPTQTKGLRLGPEIYTSIGVRPVINCRGTFTIIGGSLELPEVRAAKEAAAQHYVHIDELMEGIGQRLATLTGAEWGIVTAGCAAALSHATAACVAGGNPDRHVRIPDLTGFPRAEVVIPRHSRNVYDAAVRAVGVKIVEAETAAELAAAVGPRTAMIYFLTEEEREKGELPLAVVTKLAAERGVPVLVDAAAEVLTVPNVHLQAGATLVTYSGGKCLRGPQCAGLLLGRRNLVRAAWVHSAPHHGFGRAMKLGKEEAIGMLMAVEMWMKRDHKAEWARWLSWLDQIAARVTRIGGVTATVRREVPELTNRTPTLRIAWDPARLGITGAELARLLFTSEPRIAVQQSGGRRPANGPAETAIQITAYMMQPQDARVVANRLFAVLSDPSRARAAAPSPPPPAAGVDLGGPWDVDLEFAGSKSQHGFSLRQEGSHLAGTHRGDFVSRDLSGTVEGTTVHLTSMYRQGGAELSYGFTGTVNGDEMSGTLDLGEYLTARWVARRTR